MKKGLIALGLAGIMCFSIGAATGASVQASLINQQIVCHDTNYSKQVISYNNTTYVPLREFGDLTQTNINYQNGIIYVGENTIAPTTTPAVPEPSPVPQTPEPTPSASPAPTSIPTAVVDSPYDKSNPAPIGVPQIGTFNSFSDSHSAKICVKKVLRGAQAWKLIKNANMFNTPAPSGKEFILAKVYYKLMASDTKVRLTTASGFRAYSSSGTPYGPSGQVEPAPAFLGRLKVGGSVEGWLVFLVDKNDPAPKLVYGENGDRVSGAWFKLSK